MESLYFRASYRSRHCLRAARIGPTHTVRWGPCRSRLIQDGSCEPGSHDSGTAKIFLIHGIARNVLLTDLNWGLQTMLKISELALRIDDRSVLIVVELGLFLALSHGRISSAYMVCIRGALVSLRVKRRMNQGTIESWVEIYNML
ncbi:hypothetical protein NL676_015999 [Syzygium grande]|nr:hypothetical protein NL676_015999 [Syzygium grande]